jgi:tetratricopeptide (TPR) repeat protein
LHEILKGKLKERRYRTVVNSYVRDEERFLWINSPDLYLDSARAFLNLDIRDMAIELFKKAEPLLPEQERPADLLFHVGSDFVKKGSLAEALLRLNLFLKHYPNDESAFSVYQMKGRIFLKQDRYPEAAEMFSSALRYVPTRGKRARILIDRAKALMKAGNHQEAIDEVRKAEKEIQDSAPYPSIYEELGDLYLSLGVPKEALSVFTRALSMQTDDAALPVLRFRVAECYKRLGEQEDSLTMYEQIMRLEEPFWSNLAIEKTAEIEFGATLREVGK